MTAEAVEIQRRVQAAVRDTLSAYRTQAQLGPVSDEVMDQLLFRGAHEIMQALAQHPRDTRVLLWPSTVRLMLATFLDDHGIAQRGDQAQPAPAGCAARTSMAILRDSPGAVPAPPRGALPPGRRPHRRADDQARARG